MIACATSFTAGTEPVAVGPSLKTKRGVMVRIDGAHVSQPPVKQESDESLFERYRRDPIANKRALDLLFDRHQDALFCFLFNKHGLKVTQSEDVISKAWLSVIRKRSQLKTKFYGWLLKIVSNQAKDFLERLTTDRKRQQALNDEATIGRGVLAARHQVDNTRPSQRIGTAKHAGKPPSNKLDADPRLLAQCACGEPVKFAGSHICEDCYADKAGRYHGRSQRARLRDYTFEQRSGVIEELKNLAPDRRLAIELHFFERKSQEKVGQALGKPRKTVAYQIAQSLADMKAPLIKQWEKLEDEKPRR